MEQPDVRPIGTIWTLRLDPSDRLFRPGGPGRFQRLTAAALAVLSGAVGYEAARDEFRQRFMRGCWCCAAWMGERLAAYGWVSFNEEYVGELDLTLTLLPGEAYIWDCVTLPDFRRQGLFTSLLAYINEDLRREGYERVWIGADRDNPGSQRGIDQAGFQRIADLGIAPGDSVPARDYIVLPYEGVSPALVAAARRVYLEKRAQED
jgi:GNAT superfamily N-acetyltransferase